MKKRKEGEAEGEKNAWFVGKWNSQKALELARFLSSLQMEEFKTSWQRRFDTIQYMKGKKKMPVSFYGKPPLQFEKHKDSDIDGLRTHAVTPHYSLSGWETDITHDNTPHKINITADSTHGDTEGDTDTKATTAPWKSGKYCLVSLLTETHGTSIAFV